MVCAGRGGRIVLTEAEEVIDKVRKSKREERRVGALVVAWHWVGVFAPGWLSG